MEIVAKHLLPTPQARDGDRGDPKNNGDRNLPTRETAVRRYAAGRRNLDDGVALLPTPRAQHGEERNQNIWARPLDQPQNLENALAFILDQTED